MAKISNAFSKMVARMMVGKPEGAVERKYTIDKNGNRIYELTGIQKMIAMMGRSAFKKKVALFQISSDIDVVELNSYWKKLKEDGYSISFNTLIVKAVSLATEDHPILAGRWLSKNKLLLPQSGHINVAGPVKAGDIVYMYLVEDVSVKSLDQIQKEIREQAKGMRDGKTSFADSMVPIFYEGKTVLITSNIGVIGNVSSASTNVFLLSPFVAFCVINSVKDIPAVVNGKVVPRKIVALDVWFDHAVCEADVPIKFMERIQELVNDPEKLGPIK